LPAGEYRGRQRGTEDCRAVGKLRLLRRAGRENSSRLGPDEGAPEAKLREEARERIKAALSNGDE